MHGVRRNKRKRRARAWVRVASMVIMLREVKLVFQMPAAFVAADERGTIVSMLEYGEYDGVHLEGTLVIAAASPLTDTM